MDTTSDKTADNTTPGSRRAPRKYALYVTLVLGVLLLGCLFFLWNPLHPQDNPETDNDPQALYQRGLALTRRSKATTDDRRKAFTLMKRAADSGSCPDAAYDVGCILAFPAMAEEYGVERNAAEGLSLLESAATNGHAKAAGLMALWYSDTDANHLEWPDPEGGENWDRAVEFAEMAARAKEGHGYFVLGYAYEFGRVTGKEVDMGKAAYYFRLAAEKLTDHATKEYLQEVEAKLSEPKPPVSVTTRPGLLGGTVLQFHNRSATKLVGRLLLKDANGNGKAANDVFIKPNGKKEVGQLELGCGFTVGDHVVVRFDGHAWHFHVKFISGNSYKTWFECGK